MFAHACSNMMMRGDDKSNIICGDCFGTKERDEIKQKGPTKTLLNPPYEKGNTVEQLNFLVNALECLQKGGLGVMICKMAAVVNTGKEVVQARERLLSEHTLEAVFSMPPDLFNPAAGVATCVVVCRANQPHRKGYKTFLGYFKGDRFEVNNNKRMDSKGRWE